MNITLQANCIELSPDQYLRIDGGRGARLVCLSGELWVTQDGDLQDHFLHAGDSFPLQSPGSAIVTATHQGAVRIEAPDELPDHELSWMPDLLRGMLSLLSGRLGVEIGNVMEERVSTDLARLRAMHTPFG